MSLISSEEEVAPPAAATAVRRHRPTSVVGAPAQVLALSRYAEKPPEPTPAGDPLDVGLEALEEARRGSGKAVGAGLAPEQRPRLASVGLVDREHVVGGRSFSPERRARPARLVRSGATDRSPAAQRDPPPLAHHHEELGLLGSVKVVLVLGRVAWESWLRASGWWDRLRPAERPPFAHGAEATLPDGRILLSSFHPSRQNTNTGKLTREMWYGIFERARRLVSEKQE